jgi:tetratricopeptide (TPR) repeat protein
MTLSRIFPRPFLAPRSKRIMRWCCLARSKVHEARGDLQSAITALERAVKLDPNFEEAWYHLSMVYARDGRREEASRAGVEFSRLKSDKANRDTEIFRDLFLKTLAAQE